MPAAIDYVGRKYGRLTVLREVQKVNKSRRRFEFACDCGAVVEKDICNVRYGSVSSCGCLKREMVAAKNRKHGFAPRDQRRCPEYVAWKAMRQRCNDANSSGYGRYGGSGVCVSPAFDSFDVFLLHIGPKPSPAHSIDRINVNAGYEPGNVRWATPQQQARNKKYNRIVVFRGEPMTVSDVADRTGLPYTRVHYWIHNKGVDVNTAVDLLMKKRGIKC